MTLAAIITIVILSVLLGAAIGSTLFFLYIAYLMTEDRDKYKEKYAKQISKNMEMDAQSIVDDLLSVYNSTKK